jgi:hypothetical protein
MDTAIMAIRVALLILVTGVFAALWSGDNPDQVAAARSSRKSNENRQLTPQRDSGLISVVPLPQGISAGTYLVADQSGRTLIRVVGLSDNQSGSTRSEIESNHYSVARNGARWHFIRIETSGIGRIANERASTSVR